MESESESESECKGGIGIRVGAGTIRNRPSLVVVVGGWGAGGPLATAPKSITAIMVVKLINRVLLAEAQHRRLHSAFGWG